MLGSKLEPSSSWYVENYFYCNFSELYNRRNFIWKVFHSAYIRMHFWRTEKIRQCFTEYNFNMSPYGMILKEIQKSRLGDENWNMNFQFELLMDKLSIRNEMISASTLVTCRLPCSSRIREEEVHFGRLRIAILPMRILNSIWAKIYFIFMFVLEYKLKQVLLN